MLLAITQPNQFLTEVATTLSKLATAASPDVANTTINF